MNGRKGKVRTVSLDTDVRGGGLLVGFPYGKVGGVFGVTDKSSGVLLVGNIVGGIKVAINVWPLSAICRGQGTKRLLAIFRVAKIKEVGPIDRRETFFI